MNEMIQDADGATPKAAPTGGRLRWWLAVGLLSALAVLAAVRLTSSDPVRAEAATALQPADDAWELLDDFGRQVEAGLSYGSMRAEWPSVSSRVRKLLDQIDHETVQSWPTEWEEPAQAYMLAVADAHDAWGDTVRAVGDYLDPDTEVMEMVVTTAYEKTRGEMGFARSRKARWDKLREQ